MQAGDKVKALLSWVGDEIRSKNSKGHIVVTSNSQGTCGHLMDNAHSRNNHQNANESCCFTSGGITIFDRSRGDVDSGDAKSGWSVFQNDCSSAKRIFG